MSNSPTPLTPDQLNYADSAIFKAVLRKALTNLRVAVPAIIQEFDPVKQVATVQIAITEIVKTLSGPQATQLPLIYNVPIVLPRGGGFTLTFPLMAGDECMLVFSDMSFDLWWARGGVQDQVEARRHDLTDPVCIPGPWSQPRVLGSYSATNVQLRSDNGVTIIEITAEGNINITAPIGTISIIAENVIISPLAGGTF